MHSYSWKSSNVFFSPYPATLGTKLMVRTGHLIYTLALLASDLQRKTKEANRTRFSW